MRKLAAVPRVFLIFVLLLCGLLLCNGHFRPARSEATGFFAEIPTAIASRLAKAASEPVFIQGHRLRTDGALLQDFYARHAYRTLWFADGRPLSRMGELLAAVAGSAADGLQPNDYLPPGADLQTLLRSLASGQSEVPTPLLADVELLLTDAFVSLGKDLSFGRVNREGACDQACSTARAVALLTALVGIRDDDVAAFAALLTSFRPSDPMYGRLKELLARYRKLAAVEPPPLPPGEKLTLGVRSASVAILRERLRQRGDLSSSLSGTGDPELFDAELQAAVRRFQARHGLTPRGTVDKVTVALLNTPLMAEIRCLELNLERWRWLPHHLGDRHILVNIPAFTLAVREGGRTIMSMRTVVGRPPWYTPSFSRKMTYLQLNPSWFIPPSILRAETIPAIKKDRSYISRKKLRFYGFKDKQIHEVAAAQIDWKHVNAQRFPYLVVQAPGRSNPLGKVKFMFPNQDFIYLHDTPQKNLFQRERRAFSHGCIRLEKPLQLAEYLLASDPQWPSWRLAEALKKGTEQYVPLRQPIEVHIVYFTAWVDEQGQLQRRPDVYGSDRTLAMVLEHHASVLAQKTLP